MLCLSCLHLFCFDPTPTPNKDYQVPDAFLLHFEAMMAWEQSSSMVACCNATLKIHSVFRMVEVEVRGASIPD